MPRSLIVVALFSLALFPTTASWAVARKPSAHDAAAAPSPRAVRAYQDDLVEALEDVRAGRRERAVQRLEHLKPADSLASLYRAHILAEALLAAGRAPRADSVLAAATRAVASARETTWLRHFYRQRLRVALALPPAARLEVLRAALAAPLENPERTEVLYQLLEIDSGLVPDAVRTTYLRQILPLALAGPRLERVYRRWLDGRFPADTAQESQRLALDIEEKLGQWNQAIARATRLQAGASPEAVRALQLRVALWRFNAGDHAGAAQEYETWVARHGETPEALIQIARSYRALSRDAQAARWYDRLVAAFPRDARTAETLWMRAFEHEMAGRSDSALVLYARIARDFPAHARSGEAMFRAGLVRHRRGEYAAAATDFGALRAARKSGRLTGAARYWEGRALEAAGDGAAARAAWSALAREFPFGHYGHAARDELVRRAALPDSLEWKRLLVRADEDSVRAWLTTALPGGRAVPESFGQSAWLPVSRLFALGLDTLAVLTLQARAAAAPANLWLVYDAAVRCRKAGFGYEAYRFAMRLSDRLPLEQWPSAPVAVLRLFYPPSYAELVRPAAARADIPPALVLALIKQESGFDPRAVSRVGARGLMQLMPATGTEQARKEGLRGFHPDSLFDPRVNVTLGVAYLRDVLRRHEGHIGFALAHYNAGPTALARWMPRLEGRPPEDAVEDIGYAETREYVKRVSANYRTYNVLWESENGTSRR